MSPNDYRVSQSQGGGGAKKMTKLQVLKKDNYLSIGGSKGDIFIDQH